jgi:hypothetical protein
VISIPRKPSWCKKILSHEIDKCLHLNCIILISILNITFISVFEYLFYRVSFSITCKTERALSLQNMTAKCIRGQSYMKLTSKFLRIFTTLKNLVYHLYYICMELCLQLLNCIQGVSANTNTPEFIPIYL